MKYSYVIQFYILSIICFPENIYAQKTDQLIQGAQINILPKVSKSKKILFLSGPQLKSDLLNSNDVLKYVKLCNEDGITNGVLVNVEIKKDKTGKIITRINNNPKNDLESLFHHFIDTHFFKYSWCLKGNISYARINIDFFYFQNETKLEYEISYFKNDWKFEIEKGMLFIK
ncbi:hypothetical protein [Flavihumibacter profundi]|uniref:hypothetical protein n=1 Tax=Flavihumibacter profundi TaxID=2716883 RepID=UPI001CC424DB|nr:hypothetical protein [Flavihumibacter profundi]MBZ5856410.1 hypothetical protein [Flavihumibacter profundi]